MPQTVLTMYLGAAWLLMSSTHLLDKESIEKLENVGLTNEDVSSIEEISRGHSLPLKDQDMLLQPNSNSMIQAQTYQSALALPDHVPKFSIALAPNERLPSEILEQVFRYDSEDLGPVKLPPMLTDYRWVLGRVCSTWRRVSRSIPFWEAAVIFFGNSLYQDHGVVERAWKQLKCAVDILPKIAYIRISVNDSELPTRDLVPYLSHIKEIMDWQIYGQEPMDVLPPGALSSLKSLRLYMEVPPPEAEETTQITPSIDLFGKSSQLLHFAFTSDGAPTFLLSDIPWSQLQSFNLKVGDMYTDDSDWTGNHWIELAQRDPFQLMSSLERLELGMDAWFYGVLLPCKFPWHRLKTLELTLHDEYQHLPLILEPLKNCTSLVNLTLMGGDFFFPRYESSEGIVVHDVGPILLPSLQTLETNLPTSVVMSVSFSGTLRSLHTLPADPTTVQDFYTIATKCHHLTDYQSCLRYGEFAANVVDVITLPHLASLDISFDHPSSFPAAIIVPSLTSFKIKTEYFGPDLVRTIVNFIIRSELQLQHLSCRANFLHQNYFSLPPELVREFLATVDGCDNVDIEGTIFPQEILDEVISGLLLSHTRYLAITLASSNPDVFLPVIQHCLEQRAARAASGQAALREIRVYVPLESHMNKEEIVLDDLKVLEEKYSVKCSVQYIYA